MLAELRSLGSQHTLNSLTLPFLTLDCSPNSDASICMQQTLRLVFAKTAKIAEVKVFVLLRDTSLFSLSSCYNSSEPKFAEVHIVQTATNSVRTSKRTHPVTITNINFLTLFKEIILV
jgi:hypothetical protein